MQYLNSTERKGKTMGFPFMYSNAANVAIFVRRISQNSQTDLTH